MKLALASLNQDWEDKKANIKKCKKLLKVASKNKTDMIIFPEMTLTAYTINEKMAEDFDNSSTIKTFSLLAKKYSITIVFGLSIKCAAKLKNRLVVIDKKGDISGFYDKIHPFSYANEDVYFEGGGKLLILDIDGIRTSFSICYDLRFSEIFSTVSYKTELFINIANWPKSRISHFKTLLKARAIENQAFMLGVNRVGIDLKGIKYTKSSLAFNPYGKQIKPIFSSKELDIVEIDMGAFDEYRKKFSSVLDKKPELYRDLITEQLQ